MKKHLMVVILGTVILVSGAGNVFAHEKPYQPPKNFLNFSLLVFYPASVGYKHLVAGNTYLTGNLDYIRSEEDLRFQAGAVYMIPAKILFFRFYGGGGVEAYRNRSHVRPYVLVGIHFWILHTEIGYPLESYGKSFTRLGFSISF
jgi:hypothetical protein